MKHISTEPVLFYEKEFYVLSNFSSFEVFYKNEVWKTSEYAYQASGFTDKKIIERIKNARSSHDAMKLSKITFIDKKRKDWDLVKLGIMIDICREKLKQHFYVQKKLLQTGDRELIENSPRDSFWGWGPNKDGHNHLGKIWMKLREEIREGKIPLLKEDPEFR